MRKTMAAAAAALLPFHAASAGPAEDRKAIEAVAFDYVDGQLEGDPDRVARALHPDLAKRAVAGPGRTGAAPAGGEAFPLRRMTAEELVALTRQGELKTERSQWRRDVRVLDVAGNIAVARVETPWFVDYFHLGRFGTRWLIVNALWMSKPAAAPAPSPSPAPSPAAAGKGTTDTTAATATSNAVTGKE
jgi:hypothetical protein